MPFLLAILGVVAAIAFYVIRARNTIEITKELLDVGNDVRLAARRFGFRRKSNQHPVDGFDDPSVLIAGIATCYAKLGRMTTVEDAQRIEISLRKRLKLPSETAQEAMVLSNWAATECGTNSAALTRFLKRLHKLNGMQSFETMMGVINDITDEMTDQQREALHEIKTIFRIR